MMIGILAKVVRAARGGGGPSPVPSPGRPGGSSRVGSGSASTSSVPPAVTRPSPFRPRHNNINPYHHNNNNNRRGEGLVATAVDACNRHGMLMLIGVFCLFGTHSVWLPWYDDVVRDLSVETEPGNQQQEKWRLRGGPSNLVGPGVGPQEFWDLATRKIGLRTLVAADEFWVKNGEKHSGDDESQGDMEQKTSTSNDVHPQVSSRPDDNKQKTSDPEPRVADGDDEASNAQPTTPTADPQGEEIPNHYGSNPALSPGYDGLEVDEKIREMEERKQSRNGDGNGDGMSITWLMSFPNSGTSFTTRLVRHLALVQTGSNYGNDNLSASGKSLQVFDSQPSGPFWSDPTSHPEYHFPDAQVLVKTHCGGRCTACPTSQYSESLYSFRHKCAMGARTVPGKDGNKKLIEQVYPIERVKRAIHLVRNPFDNVVSRFHLEIRKQQRARKASQAVEGVEIKNITAMNANHNGDHDDEGEDWADRQAFREYCFAYNKKYEADEDASVLLDDAELRELTAKIPCRSEFLRFVEWHNQAFALVQDLELTDSMVLYYESYATDEVLSPELAPDDASNVTLPAETAGTMGQQLLDFLDLPLRGNVVPFVPGKTYEHFFTPEERDAVHQAFEHWLASKKTWKHLEHYFTQDIKNDE